MRVTPHIAKRKSDGKIFHIRLVKVSKQDSSFDLIWQLFTKGKWKTESKICSPAYSFHVTKEELDALNINSL